MDIEEENEDKSTPSQTATQTQDEHTEPVKKYYDEYDNYDPKDFGWTTAKSGRHRKITPLTRVIRSVCRCCGKEYKVVRGGDPNGNTRARCAECVKEGRDDGWPCNCGLRFRTRAELYAHKREVKQAGGWCGISVRKSSLECPFCHAILGTSRNKADAKLDCLINHRCERMKQYGISSVVRYVTFLKDLELVDSRESLSLDNDKTLQLIWVKGVLERNGISHSVMVPEMSSLGTSVYVYPVIKDLKVAFLIDAPEADANFYKAMIDWDTIELKWSDCILNAEEVEGNIVGVVRTKEEKLKKTAVED